MLRWSRPREQGKIETATATSSSRRWSGEVNYDDFRPISLLQRRKHIRCVANDDAGRGGNGAARTTNEHEAMVAVEIMVRRRIDDGALLHTNAFTADRQLYSITRNERVCPYMQCQKKCKLKSVISIHRYFIPPDAMVHNSMDITFRRLRVSQNPSQRAPPHPTCIAPQKFHRQRAHGDRKVAIHKLGQIRTRYTNWFSTCKKKQY